MNNSISAGLSVAGNSLITNAEAIGGLARSNQQNLASLDVQDWFSTETLDDGRTIEAASFDSSQPIASVDEAAEQIVSRLFPSG